MIRNNLTNSILGIICICLTCSCNDHVESIDFRNESVVSVFEIFSKIEVVQLETSTECIIAEPSVIHYHREHYYILDRRTQQLFCFDEKGGYRFKISNQGKGPNEYNYITDFSVDAANNLLLIMDPVLQYVHFYSSINGQHIKTLRIKADKIMGLNKVFSLNESTLLVTSVNYEQLLFIDFETGEVIRKTISYPTLQKQLNAFAPIEAIYQFEDNVYFMPILTQEIHMVDDLSTKLHFRWDFGKQNNTKKHYETLIGEIEGGRKYTLPYEGVGNGKPLNHQFIFAFETKKFHLAILEYNDSFMHILFNKDTEKAKVFKTFTENVSLYTMCFTADRAIGIERGFDSYFRDNIPELAKRTYNYYNLETINAKYQRIIKNHNPISQNPFMVIYKFKD